MHVSFIKIQKTIYIETTHISETKLIVDFATTIHKKSILVDQRSFHTLLFNVLTKIASQKTYFFCSINIQFLTWLDMDEVGSKLIQFQETFYFGMNIIA